MAGGEAPHTRRIPVTNFPLVDTAFEKSFAALQQHPQEAVAHFPYPGESQPHATTFLKSIDSSSATYLIIKDELYEAYKAAALSDIRSAAVAFRAVAEHVEKKTHGSSIVRIENFTETDDFKRLQSLMEEIAKKYPPAVGMAVQAERRDRRAATEESIRMFPNIVEKGSKGYVKPRQPSFVVAPEIVADLKIVAQQTLLALESNEPREALAKYPPGAGTELELRAYKIAALKNTENAEIALKVLTPHWNAKPNQQKQDVAYQNKAHSYGIIMEIANKYPEIALTVAGLPEQAREKAKNWVDTHAFMQGIEIEDLDTEESKAAPASGATDFAETLIGVGAVASHPVSRATPKNDDFAPTVMGHEDIPSGGVPVSAKAPKPSVMVVTAQRYGEPHPVTPSPAEQVAMARKELGKRRQERNKDDAGNSSPSRARLEGRNVTGGHPNPGTRGK